MTYHGRWEGKYRYPAVTTTTITKYETTPTRRRRRGGGSFSIWNVTATDFDADLQLLRRVDPSVDFLQMRYTSVKAQEDSDALLWAERTATLWASVEDRFLYHNFSNEGTETDTQLKHYLFILDRGKITNLPQSSTMAIFKNWVCCLTRRLSMPNLDVSLVIESRDESFYQLHWARKAKADPNPPQLLPQSSTMAIFMNWVCCLTKRLSMPNLDVSLVIESRDGSSF